MSPASAIGAPGPTIVDVNPTRGVAFGGVTWETARGFRAWRGDLRGSRRCCDRPARTDLRMALSRAADLRSRS
jgi:hypothetical protein